MGMFSIYSSLKGYELYDLINFKNSKITWEPYENNAWVHHQEITTEFILTDNIWDYLICIESLPNLYRVYYSNKFKKYIEFDNSEALYDWLSRMGYNIAKNYILRECYSCLEYSIEGVERFCKVVAHNKAEQYFLEGYIEYE